MERKGRILTGHRPTGPRHLGHLVGTLENWVRLQESYECFFLVADLHVLTTDYQHPEKIQENILDLLADWLAVGIDPDRSAIVLQSAMPQHSELSTLLGMLVTVARLQRVPTYKEQAKALGLQPTLGLLAYPVLQTSDILAYKADTVPVGEDQLPHIELSREITRRFNQSFGETFPEPQGLLSGSPRLPGTDNRTMHTSYGNTIALKDSAAETVRKIQGMYTDPTRIHATDPGHVENNPIFTYLEIFDPDREEVEEYKARYRSGRIGDVSLKRRLAELVVNHLAPMRERREKWARRPRDLTDILEEGTRRARPLVAQTLQEVKEKMGLLSR